MVDRNWFLYTTISNHFLLAPVQSWNDIDVYTTYMTIKYEGKGDFYRKQRDSKRFFAKTFPPGNEDGKEWRGGWCAWRRGKKRETPVEKEMNYGRNWSSVIFSNKRTIFLNLRSPASFFRYPFYNITKKKKKEEEKEEENRRSISITRFLLYITLNDNICTAPEDAHRGTFSLPHTIVHFVSIPLRIVKHL